MVQQSSIPDALGASELPAQVAKQIADLQASGATTSIGASSKYLQQASGSVQAALNGQDAAPLAAPFQASMNSLLAEWKCHT